MVEKSMMMIFVGTEYQGGRQFHVWLNDQSTTEDLAQAISIHESIPTSSFITQHTQFPLNPYLTLVQQGIRAYSVVHIFLLADLRMKEIKRKENLKKEYEERGRYFDKKGKLKLRRRTRKNLLKRKMEIQREKRGGGVIPCFGEFEKVSRYSEVEFDTQRKLSQSYNSFSPSIPGYSGQARQIHLTEGIQKRRKEKTLLTSTPLSRNSNNTPIDNWLTSSISPITASSSKSIIPIPTSSTTSSPSSSLHSTSLRSSPSPPSSLPISQSTYQREDTPPLPQYPKRTPSPRRPWKG